MRYIYIIIAIVIIVFGVFYYGVRKSPPSYSVPNDQSYDATSTVPIRNDNANPAYDMIEVTTPKEGDVITSPLIITGKARGSWYFEAVFPIFLTDGDGLIIANGYGQSKGDWMTQEYVPFEATLTFTKPANAAAFGNRGTLILQKDNPSGLSEHDAAIEIPVMFK